MPRIDLSKFREVYRYYNPNQRQELERGRRTEYRDQDFLLMARNLSEAFDCIHRAGYVIGDVNQRNALVNDQGQVMIIDCDSMQVKDPDNNKTYLCTVGRGEYTPPELLLNPSSGAERTQNHDCFGLTVLIFQLLMRGLHPYQIAAPCAETTVDKIKYGTFPYKGPGNTQHIPDIAHQFKEDWSRMKPSLRRRFREAFVLDYDSPRPSAAEWVDELDRIINPRPTGNSQAMERRLQVANSERANAKQQLENERSARNQAGQDLQEKERQLVDARRERIAAEQRLKNEQSARNQAGQHLQEMKRQLIAEKQARFEAEQKLANAQRGRANAEQQLKVSQEERKKTEQQLATEKQQRATAEQRGAEEERQRSTEGRKFERRVWSLAVIAALCIPPLVTAAIFLTLQP